MAVVEDQSSQLSLPGPSIHGLRYGTSFPHKAKRADWQTDDPRLVKCVCPATTKWRMPKVAQHTYSGIVYNAWVVNRVLLDETSVSFRASFCTLPNK